MPEKPFFLFITNFQYAIKRQGLGNQVPYTLSHGLKLIMFAFVVLSARRDVIEDTRVLSFESP